MKTLKVQGKGEASVAPDKCIFSMVVSEKQDDYATCHFELNSKVERLRDSLVKIGINSTSIKTSDYSISADSTYSKKLEKRIPDGFTGRHRLTVETPIDKQKMNPVFKALAEGSSDPSISITFGVSDTEAVRMQLLRNAVAAAKVNAETIADAAGISLGSIISVEYGWSEVRLYNELDYDATT
ncbi:MAG: SIMPL domain-containing protein [Desulfuromonadales bacterium]